MFKNNSEPMGIQNSFHSMEIISRSSKWLYLIFAANLLIFTLPSYGKAVDVRFSKPIADGTVKLQKVVQRINGRRYLMHLKKKSMMSKILMTMETSESRLVISVKMEN